MSWVDVDISKFTYINDPNFLDIFYEESLLATPGTTEDYFKLETTDAYKQREAVDRLPCREPTVPPLPLPSTSSSNETSNAPSN
jgi:hypothetical protein